MFSDISINIWAVVAAAASSIIIGSLWYGPVFGKYWMKLMGFTPDSIRAMNMTPMRAVSIAMISSLVMAYVLAHFQDVWGVLSMGDALTLAFWVWLGFVATNQLGGVLWEGKPWRLWVLNTANSLVTYSVMALILSYWR
jgi:hypothetical protein